MPTKDGLTIQKRGFIKTVKITGEAAPADAEAAGEFPDGIKKITRRSICLIGFQCRQNALIWRGEPQKTLISKKEKQAPGFKAGRRDQSTVL